MPRGRSTAAAAGTLVLVSWLLLAPSAGASTAPPAIHLLSPPGPRPPPGLLPPLLALVNISVCIPDTEKWSCRLPALDKLSCWKATTFTQSPRGIIQTLRGHRAPSSSTSIRALLLGTIKALKGSWFIVYLMIFNTSSITYCHNQNLLIDASSLTAAVTIITFGGLSYLSISTNNSLS